MLRKDAVEGTEPFSWQEKSEALELEKSDKETIRGQPHC